MLTLEEIASLCGFEVFFEEYVPMFLSGYYVTQLNFYLRGGRNDLLTFGEF